MSLQTFPCASAPWKASSRIKAATLCFCFCQWYVNGETLTMAAAARRGPMSSQSADMCPVREAWSQSRPARLPCFMGNHRDGESWTSSPAGMRAAEPSQSHTPDETGVSSNTVVIRAASKQHAAHRWRRRRLKQALKQRGVMCRICFSSRCSSVGLSLQSQTHATSTA